LGVSKRTNFTCCGLQDARTRTAHRAPRTHTARGHMPHQHYQAQGGPGALALALARYWLLAPCLQLQLEASS
jgi:hypothetical protein